MSKVQRINGLLVLNLLSPDDTLHSSIAQIAANLPRNDPEVPPYTTIVGVHGNQRGIYEGGNVRGSWQGSLVPLEAGYLDQLLGPFPGPGREWIFVTGCSCAGSPVLRELARRRQARVSAQTVNFTGFLAFGPFVQTVG